ncbi:ttn-1 [Symbiodinium natans]|uniref:Ttn-1 protein n=1 Tax=Symbiodinium natans TaxID=878477 RepID=A0A812LI34_9DINO|nr:ttn-1 [Symbiodinium natans]
MTVQLQLVDRVDVSGIIWYHILVTERGQQWQVKKTYHEFLHLDAMLSTSPFARPPLPEQGTFGFRAMFNIGDFNQKRQVGLANYLAQLAQQLQSLAQLPILQQWLQPAPAYAQPVVATLAPTPMPVANPVVAPGTLPAVAVANAQLPVAMPQAMPDIPAVAIGQVQPAAVSADPMQAMMASAPCAPALPPEPQEQAVPGQPAPLVQAMPGQAQPVMGQPVPVQEQAVSEQAVPMAVPGQAVPVQAQAMPVMGQVVPMPGQALPQPALGQVLPLPAGQALPVQGQPVSGTVGQAVPIVAQAIPLQAQAFPNQAVSAQGMPTGHDIAQGMPVSVQAQALPGAYAQPDVSQPGASLGDGAKLAAGAAGLAVGLGTVLGVHGKGHGHDSGHRDSEYGHSGHSEFGHHQQRGYNQGDGDFGGAMFGGFGRERCYKCHGRGFSHDSTMNHDKDEDERCFFCKDCTGCNGTGHISAGSGGGWFAGAQRCYKCHGRGFSHNSSMNHDKDEDERCFFCEDCTGCNGRGHL